jgi:hypothetical protein
MVSRTLAAFLLFAAINIGLNLMPLKKAVPVLGPEQVAMTDKIEAEGMPASWWLARTYIQSEKVPDIVVCGSSQIGGLQAADANSSGKTIDFVSNRRSLIIEDDIYKQIGLKPTVFLSALPGAMVSDHFAIGRALYKPQTTPSLVVLTVSPRDFIDNTLSSAGATDSYRFFSQYSDMKAYTNLAFHDPRSRFDYFVSNELPLRLIIPDVQQTIEQVGKRLTALEDGWLKAVSDNESRDAGTAGDASAASSVASKKSGSRADPSVTQAEQLKFVMGAYGGNLKPGQAVLTPNLPKIYVDNSLDYMHRYANAYPPTYKVQLAYMRAFLADLKKRGVKVLVVGMPLTKINRDLLTTSFWKGFRRNLAEQCKLGDAVYLDLSDSPDFSQGDFCDTVHLNADGGTRLADHIARAIANSKELRQALETKLKSMAQESRSSL